MFTIDLMQSSSLEEKRIFTIVSDNTDTVKKCGDFITAHVANSVVFTAEDGVEALFKMDNVVPHVVLVDYRVDKIPAYELTAKILKGKKTKNTSIILICAIPDSEHFVDEVVKCRVQFLPDIEDAQLFNRLVTRALNRIAIQENSSYKLRFIGEGDTLFNENDPATSIFFVKRGTLIARQNSLKGDVTLGNIKFGEFVGEMAHFNLAPRSATVMATSDCELIEIPFDALEVVLFSKPAWSRALIATLTHRLKETNKRVKT